jgi:hypothetical protein
MTTITAEKFVPDDFNEKPENESPILEKVKNVANRGVEFAGRVLDFNSHADFVEEKFGQLKDVAINWKDDVLESLRMNTIEKWRFLKSRDSSNSLINLKQKEISDIGYRIDNHARNVGIFSEIKKTEVGNFEEALKNMKNPGLIAVFEKNRDLKAAEWDQQILEEEEKGKASAKERDLRATEVETLSADIEAAEGAFSGKIDARIHSIHEKTGYTEKKESMIALSEQIEVATAALTEVSQNIETYTDALAKAKELGVLKDDIQMIESQLAELKQEKNLTEKTIANAEKSKVKLSKQIAKIDAKAQKWQSLKDSMGLSKKSEPVEAEALVNNLEEGDVEGDGVEVNGKLSESNSENMGEDESTEVVEQNASHTDESEVRDEAAGGDEVESIEQLETAPEAESREVQLEKFTAYFGELYKLSNMLTPNAAELLGKLKEVEPLLEEFAEILGNEGEAVALAIRDMIKVYSQDENIESLRGQLKKDILNKIIRKLPESIIL